MKKLIPLVLFSAVLAAGATPFSLGKVVVATSGTPVQLGVTTLSANVTSTTAASFTVASNNAIPLAAAGTFVATIDSEQFRVLANSSTTWQVSRGYNGTTAATHSSGATVTVNMPVYWLYATVYAGSSGKGYLGTASMVISTFVGVIKELWPNASGGVDDNFALPWTPFGAYQLSQFWVDDGVSGEGLIISGLTAP